MTIFITGICGFVGSAIARRIRDVLPNTEIFGLDNLGRPGSERNRRLATEGIRTIHGDIRVASDLEAVPPARWVIDAAALPSVLAGIDGVGEEFCTAAPVSLYGATKLASETLALEYGEAFEIPVWVNRCGVLAGAGQFGTAEQGIFSFWLHAWRARKPLRYIGFGGKGLQVRDALHPEDLADLILKQIQRPAAKQSRICNVSGGVDQSMSLLELSLWCKERFGPHEVASDPHQRIFDIPWMVLDSARAAAIWNWKPRRSLLSVLDEIAGHAEKNPDWLDLTG